MAGTRQGTASYREHFDATISGIRQTKTLCGTQQSVRLRDFPSSSAPTARLLPGVRAAAGDTELWSGYPQKGCSDRPLFSAGSYSSAVILPGLRLESLQLPLTPASPAFPTFTQSPQPTDFTNFLLHLPAATVFRQARSSCEDYRSSSMHRLSAGVAGHRLPPPPSAY